MSDNDHEHRAYQVWDGDSRWASTAEVQQLHYRITELALQLDELEDTLGELAARLDARHNRDGSLARSQLTDEQRADAGIMTSEQTREHGQLRKLDHPRPADRGPATDDKWAGQPAGGWETVTPEDTPGSSNGKQHQRLGILYQQLGLTERDTRLAEMTDRVGRVIASAKDLSYQEAAAAIVELEKLAAKGAAS